MRKDICCVGHITLDKIIVPGMETYLNGGTSYYVSYALNQFKNSGVSYKLITSLAQKDMQAVEDMRAVGIDVDVIESRNTVFFENKYEENMNNRTQRVLAKADPFTIESVRDIDAKFVHLGSLLADDFSVELIKYLSTQKQCRLCVDAQGFLRYVEGENVHSCDWHNKLEIFPYIDILKVNEHEILSLTGYSDPIKAGEQLVKWGIKEVLITLGSYGSVIYMDGKSYEIPAYKPKALVDATGCGDTYAAGYLYKRAQGAPIEDCGKFAAAMCSLKIAHTGPFDGTEEDVMRLIAQSK